MKPMRNPMVVLRPEADGWAVLFNPDTRESLGVNPVGVEIWKLLDGDTSVEVVAAAVAERFHSAPATVLVDAEEFVARLVSKGFAGLEVELNYP